MRYLATKQECVCQQTLCILLFYYIHSGCDPFESLLMDQPGQVDNKNKTSGWSLDVDFVMVCGPM
jgi:hypothetical protein